MRTRERESNRKVEEQQRESAETGREKKRGRSAGTSVARRGEGEGANYEVGRLFTLLLDKRTGLGNCLLVLALGSIFHYELGPVHCRERKNFKCSIPFQQLTTG